MTYNDNHVLTILRQFGSDSELNLDEEIEKLTPEQRFFLHCKLKYERGCDLAIFETEEQVLQSIQALFCNNYDKSKFLLENVDRSCDYAG
ncbi:MAG: hypothetical protein ACTSR2_12425, partial [Candidatus Hodarchaeales archaeon]